MKKYYVLINNKVKGPFSISQLSKYKLEKNTNAYYVGMPEWSTVEYISELNALVNQPMPVFKTKATGNFSEIVKTIFLVLFVSIAF